MKYLLTSLKFCSGTYKLPMSMCLERILSFSVCASSVYRPRPRLNRSAFLPSVGQDLGVKRSNHVSSVQEITDKEDTPFYYLKDSETSSITNDDPVLEKKLKILILEVEVMRQSGEKVPEEIKLDQWKELIKLDTRSKRRKYLSFLFIIEKKQENRKQKKEEKRKNREADLLKENVAPDESGHIIYGLGHNTIFLRVYDTTINHMYNSKLIQAIQFSQKIVVDCSYDSHMTTREALNCGKQIMLLFADNRAHDSPFNIYLCNAKRENPTIKQLVKYIPTLYDPDFPINVTEESYLDLFPKEDLVYLTPHCREELKTFDHDAIYIIGAMIDKGNHDPLSLAKAKREGLKMAKLPLDKHLTWGSGSSKSLSLNHMIRILLDIRSTGCWEEALTHVPRRKIVRSTTGTSPDFQDVPSEKIRKSSKHIHYTFKDRSSKY